MLLRSWFFNRNRSVSAQRRQKRDAESVYSGFVRAGRLSICRYLGIYNNTERIWITFTSLRRIAERDRAISHLAELETDEYTAGGIQSTTSRK